MEVTINGIRPTAVTGTVAGIVSITNDGTKTTIMGITGDYIRIGDANTTVVGLASEDDLLVTGQLEVAGTASFSAILDIISPGLIRVRDDLGINIGSGSDSTLIYETADADARCIIWVLDESDDTGDNVPAWVFAEHTNVYAMDLGLLDEVVQPHIVTLANGGQLHSATDGIADAGAASAVLKHVGGFTAAVVGDIVRITAGNLCTTGWYWITTVTSADQVTLDRDYTSGDTTNVAFQTWHKVAMVTPKAIYMPIYDGAPQDTDIDIDMDGACALDVANSRFYWRAGAGWHYAAQDAGFEVNKDDVRCPVCNKLIEVGQAVVGRIDKVLSDGARHGLYCHLSCLS